MEHYDVIILGAGPAGLTAAAVAGKAGARVLVLEKSARPGRKLLLAGGGKGNVTNRVVGCSDYVGEYTDFAAYALELTSSETIMTRFSDAGIALEEREFGQIFCVKSAGDILEKLLNDLPDTCRVARNLTAQKVTPPGVKNSGLFTVHTGEASFCAPKLIAATGSPACPQCGADDSGLKLMRALGHKIIPVRPVLVPFVMGHASPFAELAGISVTAHVRLEADTAPTFTAPLLFTHKGMSGPAMLQLSCFWRKGQTILIDFLPKDDITTRLDTATGKTTPRSLLSKHIPERLAIALLPPALAQRRIAELSRKDRIALAQSVHAHPIMPARTQGMLHAEAAAGGVDTREFDPYSMQSRIVPGLFCCGEMLDITGRLGGYNLHWAWASGTVAGHGALC